MKKEPKVLLIGVGPQAQRTYLPTLAALQKKGYARLASVVELTSEETITKERLHKAGFDLDNVEQVYVEDDLVNYRLSTETERSMEALVKRHDIAAVIISTNPLAHKAYALWALKHDLPILMDKPISTLRGVAHDVTLAKSIYDDYHELATAYRTSKSPLFGINVQRRYHPGFQMVFDKVAEIAERFNVPVTAMQSSHADGQWRLPEEMLDIDYHGYNRGIGKVSHSGYHFIDIMAKIIKLSYGAVDLSEKPNKVGIFSSFIGPRGILALNPQENYQKIFGKEYANVSQKTNHELRELYQGFGEVDASTIIQLMRDDEVLANFTLNLIHNSFSRRSWPLPNNSDLYKGNGRVKHEYHSIQQGPLQNIQIHSYQKNDKHDTSTDADLDIGGNNHFDILIFRNNGITGDKEPFQKFTMADFNKETYTASYVHDSIKHEVVEEFIDAVRNNQRSVLTAPFEDQELAVLLMSLIYQSGASRRHVEQAIDRFIA